MLKDAIVKYLNTMISYHTHVESNCSFLKLELICTSAKQKIFVLNEFKEHVKVHMTSNIFDLEYKRSQECNQVFTFKKFITNINMLKIFAFILFFGCSLGIPQLDDVAPLEPEFFEDKMEDSLPEFEDFALATPEDRSALIGSIIAGVGGVCVFAGTKLFEADIARCNQVASDPDLGGLEWVKCMYGVFNK